MLAPLSLLVALGGCARSGDAEIDEQVPATPEEAPPAWSATTPLAPIPEHEGPVKYQQMNIEIAVADPAKTLAAARNVVLSLGGEVTQANASPGASGSLTAMMPPQAVERLRGAIGKLPGTIRSEQSSTNDMTPHCDMLRDRLAQLAIAEAELERIMRTTREPQVFDAMLIQRELGTRERENLRQQLTQQLQQTKRAQFYLTITPDVAAAPEVIREAHRLDSDG
ncbi:MAG TPA: DUF4349 domain-containing protein [Nannocystaceae bacterium]|nr:DUF4349 domain-containing protein [Nannocystaceae bacterium]